MRNILFNSYSLISALIMYGDNCTRRKIIAHSRRKNLTKFSAARYKWKTSNLYYLFTIYIDHSTRL